MKKEKLLSFHKIFIILTILLLLTSVAVSCMLGSTRAAENNSPIEKPINELFPDTIFAQFVAEELGKSPSDVISTDELSIIEYVWMSGASSIEGIQYLENMHSFVATEGELWDLSPIEKANFSELYLLGLENNKISDISPLKNINKLTQLFLNQNQIEDISMVHDFEFVKNHLIDDSALSIYIAMQTITKSLTIHSPVIMDDLKSKFSFGIADKIETFEFMPSHNGVISADNNQISWGEDDVAVGDTLELPFSTSLITVSASWTFSGTVLTTLEAPSIDPISLSVNKPTEKKYHGITTPNTDTVKVEIKIPKAVFDDESNAFLRDELTEAKYVIIPFDPANANYSDVPTREQFQAAYTAAEDDQKGSFLQPGQTMVSGDVDQNLEYPVEVTDNCKVWVMIKEVAPTRTEDHFAVYTADNFYTPIQVYHKGLDVVTDDPYDPYNPDLPQKLVYDAMSVGYEDANNDGVPDSYYGIPLDANKNVIIAPSLGYDGVNVEALDTLPVTPIDLNEYWLWSDTTPLGARQEKSVTLIFDKSYADAHPSFLDRTPSAENTHNFYYEKAPYVWISQLYNGLRMPGKLQFRNEEFVMTPNPEYVMRGVEIVRTPPVIDGWIAYGYMMNWGGAEVHSAGGVVTFTPESDYFIMLFLYKEESVTLNVRQVLIDADEMIKPLSGYMTLYHLYEPTGDTLSTIGITTTTGVRDIPYSKYLFPLSRFAAPFGQLQVSAILPEYYTYLGYTLSYTTGDHNADDRVLGDPVLELSTNRDVWVTIYITPTSKTLDFFNWDSAINDIGTILFAPPI